MLNDLPTTPGVGHGGAEVVVERLAGALRALGHEVLVQTRSGPRSGAALAGALWDPFEARRVAAVVRSFRPDVVHAHNVLRELSPSVLWAVRRLPLVMTVHDLRVASIVLGQRSGPERFVDARLKQPFDARLVRRVVDAYVTVGPDAAAVLQAAHFGPVTVIEPPGPGWAEPTQPPSTFHDLAFIGRVAADKGVGVAIAAFAALSPAPAGRLLVVGDGPLRRQLEATAPQGVTFLGRLGADDLCALLGTVRAVVIPSLPSLRPETSSLASIEAAWMGRPVVVSDDPAASGLVRRLGAGIVVPAGDLEGLTAAMADLLGDDALVDRLGASGAVAVRRRHTPKVVAERHVAVYEQVQRPGAA